MTSRARAFLRFVRHFAHDILYVREVLVGLVLLIILGGIAISHAEGIALGKSIYFAFITGLSIGYGDITPQTALGHVLAIGIGMIGMLFTGITVAIATRALAHLVHERVEHER